MKVAIIGGGVMGEALVASVLRRGLVSPAELTVCEIVAQKREHLAATYGVKVGHDAAEAVRGADVVVLAVKPQEFPTVAASLKGQLQPKQAVLSIMAGVKLATIKGSIGYSRVVRAMPNTPARIGAGVTVWVAAPEVETPQKEMVRNILGCLGAEVEAPEEKLVDMATAVSGSGPGFIFLLMEALVDGAVHIGMPRPMATALAIHTFLGSALYAQKADASLAELRGQVVSPGGTTSAGLLALEKAGVRAAIIEAVAHAYRRALELGGEQPLGS